MNRNRKIKRILICMLVVAGILLVIATNANADFVFGEPENLGSTINTSSNEGLASIASDGLSLYFTSNRPGGFGEVDLWQAKRATIEDEWAPAVNLGSTINSVARDFWPNVSSDNLTLYFCSDRSDGQGNEDIWKITRPTVDDQWGPAENLGLFVNTPSNESGPCISADNLELYFTSDRSGNIDIYVSRRASTSDAWGEPVSLSTLNTTDGDAAPSLSADGLILFFESYRPGGFGGWDLYMSTRTTKNTDWSSPINVGSPINTSFNEIAPCISFDGCTLYFCYHPQTDPRPGGLGGNDIWQVTIDPVVDINADGIVDSADMCIIIDNWGTDEPLCDIGPTPFGDGVVDVQDLIVLAEHLFEEVI